MKVRATVQEEKQPRTSANAGHSTTESKNQIARMLWPIGFGGLALGLYSRSMGAELLFTGGAVLGLILLGTNKLRVSAADWVLSALILFEIPSVFASHYRPNSIRFTGNLLIGALAFFTIRLTLVERFERILLSEVFTLGGAMAGIIAIREFALHATTVYRAGFIDLVAFRSRLMSPPWVLGEWLTLLVLALPFACAVPLVFWFQPKRGLAIANLLLVLPIATAICLSLSRAIFWSTVVFCLATCGLLVVSRVLNIGHGAVLLALALVFITVLLLCQSLVYPGVARAYFGGEISQTRSAAGRIGIWERSLAVIKTHPFVGVGSSNAALALMSTAGEEEEAGFASRTFSLPVQVLLEKGVLGFLFYAAFLFAVTLDFIRSMVRSHDAAERAMRCCFAAGLLAVLVREIVYSSLFEHALTFAVFMSLCALVCTPGSLAGRTE